MKSFVSNDLRMFLNAGKKIGCENVPINGLAMPTNLSTLE